MEKLFGKPLGALFFLLVLFGTTQGFAVAYPGYVHRPTGVTPTGDCVTLDDGSCWEIFWEDSYKTLDWLATDLLYLRQNPENMQVYNFQIYNDAARCKVACRLISPPSPQSPYAHYMVRKDECQQHLVLEDGSRWRVYENEDCFLRRWRRQRILQDWAQHDLIIVGSNIRYDKSVNPYILINARTKTRISANLVP